MMGGECSDLWTQHVFAVNQSITYQSQTSTNIWLEYKEKYKY